MNLLKFSPALNDTSQEPLRSILLLVPLSKNNPESEESLFAGLSNTFICDMEWEENKNKNITDTKIAHRKFVR